MSRSADAWRGLARLPRPHARAAGTRDQTVERRPEDGPGDRVRPLRGVVIRDEARTRVDDDVALLAGRMSTEPAPEGVGAGASGGRVGIADEEVDERAPRKVARWEATDRSRREDAEDGGRRGNTPGSRLRGVGEDGAAAERLSHRDDRKTHAAEPSERLFDAGLEGRQSRSGRFVSGRSRHEHSQHRDGDDAATDALPDDEIDDLATVPRRRERRDGGEDTPRQPGARQMTLQASTAPGYSGLHLGVVCPMANEAATAVRFVDAVLTECRRYGFAAITLFAVVDTVSRDSTRSLLETHRTSRPQLQVVWAPEASGVADAYVRGYREALAAGCDWILEIDAGFSHDPAEIGRLLDAMAGDRDCVFGSRFADGGDNLGALRRRVISRGGTALANLLLGTRLSDMTGGFELFTRATLETILAKGIRSTGPFFQTEIKTHCRELRFAEVPIHYNAPSHDVGIRAIREALANLARLFCLRLVGAL